MYRIWFYVISLIVCSCVPVSLRAQSGPEAGSVRSSALAGAVVGYNHGNPLDANPASSPIDSAHAFAIEGLFSPNIAGLDHSNQIAATLATKLEVIDATVGAGFVRYGYGDLFSDQTIALSLQRSFQLGSARSANAGLRARYRSFSFGEAAPPISSLLLDAGLQFSLTSTIGIGVAAQNLLGAHLIVADGSLESYKRDFDFGLVISPLRSKISIAAAARTTIGDHTRGKFAAEYSLEDYLVLRIGALTDPSVITGGIGLKYHGIALDAGIVSSPLNTQLTLGFGWQW